LRENREIVRSRGGSSLAPLPPARRRSVTDSDRQRKSQKVKTIYLPSSRGGKGVRIGVSFHVVEEADLLDAVDQMSSQELRTAIGFHDAEHFEKEKQRFDPLSVSGFVKHRIANYLSESSRLHRFALDFNERRDKGLLEPDIFQESLRRAGPGLEVPLEFARWMISEIQERGNPGPRSVTSYFPINESDA
jgi:hypothetical protein